MTYSVTHVSHCSIRNGSSSFPFPPPFCLFEVESQIVFMLEVEKVEDSVTTIFVPDSTALTTRLDLNFDIHKS